MTCYSCYYVYVLASTCITFIIIGCLFVNPVFKFTGSVTLDSQFVDIKQLDQINKAISKDIRDLAKSRFFRVYKVDIDAECPFWSEDMLCVTNTCGLKYCPNVEIDRDWHIGTTIYPIENSINKTENQFVEVLTDKEKFKFTLKNPLITNSDEEFEKHLISKWIDLEDTHHDAHFVDIEENYNLL